MIKSFVAKQRGSVFLQNIRDSGVGVGHSHTSLQATGHLSPFMYLATVLRGSGTRGRETFAGTVASVTVTVTKLHNYVSEKNKIPCRFDRNIDVCHFF